MTVKDLLTAIETLKKEGGLTDNTFLRVQIINEDTFKDYPLTALSFCRDWEPGVPVDTYVALIGHIPSQDW